ncbi:hypothetical protein LCGC14_2981810 [marine sediment metagenome]|uniref:Uncharacterized protein n=1 Tax=marine sediment metagenome TaxID=412755 RepID=A0A0F8ZXL3_9ZZZZ
MWIVIGLIRITNAVIINNGLDIKLFIANDILWLDPSVGGIFAFGTS